MLKSHEDGICFLPALPKQWANGFIKGISARGGYTVDIEWKNGLMENAVIHEKASGSCNIITAKKIKIIH